MRPMGRIFSPERVEEGRSFAREIVNLNQGLFVFGITNFRDCPRRCTARRGRGKELKPQDSIQKSSFASPAKT